MSYTPVKNPMPVTFTDITKSRTLDETMDLILIELKLMNIHLHELPRALNDGYSYSDVDDVELRDELSKE